MLSRTTLCDLIGPEIEALGLELFDVDLPSANSGVLRIFITRPVPHGDAEIGATRGKSGSEKKSNSNESVERNGVTLDDCAAVSRAISALEGFEDSLPSGVTLEVSSPGVNRRLRTLQHFEGAVGEHLSIKRIDENNRKSVLKGTLMSFDGELLQFRLDGSDEVTGIPYADIADARVEFLFQ